MIKRTLVVALALTAAFSLAGCQKASDAVFGARVRSYLLDHPEILQEMATRLDQQTKADADARQKVALRAHRQDLEHDGRDFVANPDGKVTVVEFFDYRCTYCKAAMPQLMDLIEKNPDIRFVFKEFPILTTDSHAASATVLAAKDSGKYLSLHQRLFAAPSLSQAQIDQIVANAGLDPAALHEAAQSQPVQTHLADNHQLAVALGIDGTPTFVVGDKVIAGADMNALKAAIDQARKDA